MDIAANVFGTEKFVETGLFKRSIDLGAHAGEDDADALALAHLTQVGEVVNAGGIEGMNDGTGLAEKLTVLLIFLVCFVITIAVRVKRARDRRRELEE